MDGIEIGIMLFILLIVNCIAFLDMWFDAKRMIEDNYYYTGKSSIWLRVYQYSLLIIPIGQLGLNIAWWILR